jgi:hypothetical protein
MGDPERHGCLYRGPQEASRCGHDRCRYAPSSYRTAWCALRGSRLWSERIGSSLPHTKGSGQNDELVEEPVTRTPPHCEPIVPYEGNRLKTPSFVWL